MNDGQYIGGTQPLLRYVKLPDGSFKGGTFCPDAVDGSSNRHVSAMDVGAARAPRFGGANMQAVATIGLAEGKVVVRRQLKCRYLSFSISYSHAWRWD
jgi:hypothetical protein